MAQLLPPPRHRPAEAILIVVSSLDVRELADSGFGEAEPWTSPGVAAQRPPRLLLTLLGDYWWQRTEPLPSAAIVALLTEFGVSDSAARAALTRNGLLVTSKTGRRTFARAELRDPRRRRTPHLLFRRGEPAVGWQVVPGRVLYSCHGVPRYIGARRL
jgi:hypothetical protein